MKNIPIRSIFVDISGEPDPIQRQRYAWGFDDGLKRRLFELEEDAPYLDQSYVNGFLAGVKHPDPKENTNG